MNRLITFLLILMVTPMLYGDDGPTCEPYDTIEDQVDALKKMQAREKHAPKVGDDAPDFTLSDLNGENPVTLSEVCREKPLVLIFGSYT